MSAVIQVKNVTKRFPIFQNRPSLKEWVVGCCSGKKNSVARAPYFTALDQISFSVEKGECLGVIGKNGAGKSTLLSVLLGTSYPTQGEVVVEGKRAPLLELGAGFHPDLTGRENVILNGVLLGLSRAEVLRRMDQIIEFSELKDFVLRPVRTYSSGMYLRLAFAVLLHVEPEVLLVDEILAVGDESFQKKSEAALLNLIRGGASTVFVSHDMRAVEKICTRVLWLEKGRIRADGEPQKIIAEYHASNAVAERPS